MKGNAFRIFLGNARRIGGKVCVPEIVVDEVVNAFREATLALAENLGKVSRRYADLLDVPLTASLASTDVEEAVGKYRQKLQHAIEQVGSVLPYPEVTHEELVRRDLSRRKPFSETGKGYRDALIWHSILGLAEGRSDDQVIVVTGNTTDFGKGPDVHEHLQQDLAARSIPLDRVRIYERLEEFNAAHILPTLGRLDKMIDVLDRDAAPGFSLKNWLGEHLQDELNEREFGDFLAGLEQGHGHAHILDIVVKSVVVDDVRVVREGRLLVSAVAEITSDVEVSVDSEDFQHRDVRDIFGALSPADEGAYDITTEVSEDAKIAFSLILEEANYSVLSFEIDEIDAAGGFVELESHPRRPGRPLLPGAQFLIELEKHRKKQPMGG